MVEAMPCACTAWSRGVWHSGTPHCRGAMRKQGSSRPHRDVEDNFELPMASFLRHAVMVMLVGAVLVVRAPLV